MSSTSSTNFLGLNLWESTDSPKKDDFNADNMMIDRAYQIHIGDIISHITSNERKKWNSMYFTNSYFGDGTAKRTIETECPFTPSFGIVFAIDTAASVTNFSSGLVQNYFAIMTQRGGTIGASFSGKNIIVTNNATPEIEREFALMNAVGYTYMYILFR